MTLKEILEDATKGGKTPSDYLEAAGIDVDDIGDQIMELAKVDCVEIFQAVLSLNANEVLQEVWTTMMSMFTMGVAYVTTNGKP